MQPGQIEQLILAAMPGATARVQSEDNTHFNALVVAEQFAGKRSLQRHQLVYAAIGDAVGREIHALSIEALTPAEWSARGGNE